MKKIFAFAVVALMMLAIPAAAANYKLTGEFKGGYDYANGAGTDNLGLTLAFNFDEAGIVTAYAPLSFLGSAGVSISNGWWAKFLTPPLNVVISDNFFEQANQYAGLEGTFGLLGVRTSSKDLGNRFRLFGPGIFADRYSKVWGNVIPELSYAAAAVMDDVTDYYAIAGQLGAKLPLELTLTTDFGWLHNVDGNNLGLAAALTGAVPVIGGNFKVAVGNFADLDPVNLPWGTDDLQAFAAYAGVTGVKLGPVTLDEISYKMGMVEVYDPLLIWTPTEGFYTRGLQEVTTNATAVLGPLTVVLKNGLWFQSFNALGGNNANLDVAAAIGPVELGLNIDSKLNWATTGLKHGELATLRAEYSGLIGTLGGELGYNSNWDGVGKYVVDPANNGADQVFGSVYYDAAFAPLHVEAYGDYNQFGTNTANAGIYAKYENTYTTVPYIVDLKALVAGRFGYTWTELPSNDMEAIGMLKLDSTINGLWSAGLLFISRNIASPAFSFEPIASVYAKYKASDMVTVTGTVTYRGEDLFGSSPASPVLPTHAVYVELKGDIKISDNAKATVYWGNSGVKEKKGLPPWDMDYGKPWTPYFNVVDPMYWDSFGANFSIKF